MTEPGAVLGGREAEADPRRDLPTRRDLLQTLGGAGTDVTDDVTTLDASGTLVATVHSDPSGVVTGATYLVVSTAPLCDPDTCTF